MLHESGYRSNDCRWQKIAAVHGGSYAERMFRLLQKFGMWGAIKADLCHLTSAASMSQQLQDYRHNCKELIACIFVSWMPIFYAWMSTPWSSVSSSLAWDLAHSGSWLVSPNADPSCHLGALWVRTQFALEFPTCVLYYNLGQRV